MERGNLSSRGRSARWSSDRWSAGSQEKSPSGRNREDHSTDARHRGGPPGSSDEGSVMGLERSGWAIQAKSMGNRVVSGKNR